jgi:aminomethyltransferase
VTDAASSELEKQKTASLRRTPLYALHHELGARFTEFGGWELPLSYSQGTVFEHLVCRNDAVIFDVSHLGTLALGEDAFDAIQSTCTNDLAKIGPGRTQYTLLCNDTGGVRDDCIVWWLPDGEIQLLPNAANTDSVRQFIGGIDITEQRALLAIQGPTAREKLRKVLPAAADVPRHGVARIRFGNETILVAGTGYTGEDGVECAVPIDVAATFFKAVVDVGVAPAGLGARDTLRLEAGLPLHGHDLSPQITPVMANLSWAVGWEKDSFFGRDALLSQRENGVGDRLFGFVGETRQPFRDGALIKVGDEVVGHLTSGGYSPLRECGIGLGLCRSDAITPTTSVTITVRSRELNAHMEKPPFNRKR